MSVFIGQGGVWKEWLSNTSIGAGGVNKAIRDMYVGAGGAWKQFFTRAAAFVVTVGGTSGFFGFTSGGIGSITPSPAGAINGETINNVGTNTSSADDFQVILGGGPHSQDFFTSVMVEDDSGIIRTYDTASATFSGGDTWTWGLGSDDVWTNASVGINRDLTFIL